MARQVSTELAACLERENAYTQMGVEVAAPNVGKVLRRPLDQLLLAPDPLVSLAPAAGLVAAPAGGVQIAPTSSALFSYATDSGSYLGLLPAVPGFFGRALAWQVDPAFDRAVLRSIAIGIARVANAGGSFFAPAITLQIWRAAAVVGEKVDGAGNRTPYTQWSFAPLIPGGIKLDAKTVWGPSKSLTSNTITFDLTGFGIVIDGSHEPLPSNVQNGRATYYIELTTDVGTADTVRWFMNTGASPSIAGVGSFSMASWAKASNADPGAITTTVGVPNVVVNCDQYNPVGGAVQAVYHLDLGAAPAAGATGRIRFERALPLGTGATVELSTAGSGGPWTPVQNGDAVALAQQAYHLRATLTPSASKRATPVLTAIGIEFRTTYDASVESIISPLARDVAMPLCAASIADGELRVLRAGRRDFDDVASQLGSTSPATKLEVDLFLRSAHPTVTRDKWLRMDRATVVDRVPTETGERFQLRSFQDTLKRQIPLPVETINAAFVVASGTTATAVKIVGALPGASAGGNEYDGKRYYMRVRSSASSLFANQPVFTIAGNTSTNQLDFATNDLPGALLAGDVIEVHSGVLQAPKLTYKDWDPADVWWDLLANQLQTPVERIGAGHLPRGGLPPKVTDRAPGDATTQAKCKVSVELDQAEAGDALLDQVSFLMGGATIEIDGQICFVQVYPLRDGSGNVSVPLPPSRYTWDPRDYFALNCPQGLTKRQTSVKCSYGVDLTVPEASRLASSITDYTDVDAVAWLALTDTESRGLAELPDDVARWCYNSADAGLFLASEACWQVCRYFSTGMRIWDWATRDQFPELHPGDVVTIITDAYTDFDLVGQTPVVGWQAYTLVLLGVDAGGRKFRGVVPGLNPSSARSLGGQAGEDLGTALGAVTCPAITLSIEAAGLGAVPQPVVIVDFTVPTDARFDHLELVVQSANGTAGAGAQGSTAPLRIQGTWGDTLTITPICVSTAGVADIGTSQVITLALPNAMSQGGGWPDLVSKNQKGDGTTSYGNVNWGVTAAGGDPFTHPNGTIYTVPQQAESKTSLAASGANELGSVVLAFVGSDRTRFNFTPAPEGNLDRFKWFVGARFRTTGWQYFDGAAWQAFTPNENDCVVAQARRLIGSSSGIEALDVFATKTTLAGQVRRSATNSTPMDVTTQYLQDTGHLHPLIEDGTGRAVTGMFDKASDTLDDVPQDASGGAFLLPPAVGGEISVENANFEAAPSALEPVPGYHAAGATLALETSAPYSGTQSLKVVASSSGSGAVSNRRWRVRPGERYRVSAALKSLSSGYSARAALVFLDAAGASTGAIEASTNSTTWASVTGAAGTVPAGSVTAVLECLTAGAAGTVWFDDIRIDRIRDGAELQRGGGDTTTIDVIVGQLDNNGYGGAGFGVVSASVSRAVARGLQEGDIADGGTLTFVQAFAGAPMILPFRQGRALAAPNPSGTWVGGTYNAAAYTYLDLRAINVTAAAMTLRAKFIQYGSTTARNDDFASGSATSAGQHTGTASLANAPSNTDQYTCRGRLTLVADCTGGTDVGTTRATIILESNDGTGSGWQERYRDTRSVSNDTQSSSTLNIDYAVTVSVSGMGVGDQFRWTLVTESLVGDAALNPGTSGATLSGNTGSNNNGQHGVSYNTTSGDVTQSLTPNAGDVVHVYAQEVT